MSRDSEIAAQDRCKHGYTVRDDDPTVQECIDRHQAAAPYRPSWHFGAGFFKGFGLGITLRPTEYDIVIGPWTMWVFYE